MLDLQSETVLTFAEAGAKLARPAQASTVSMWARRGVRGHKLESTFQGGRRLTTAEAVERFLSRVNGAVAAVSGG